LGLIVFEYGELVGQRALEGGSRLAALLKCCEGGLLFDEAGFA
jgi:hypothetical protein